MNLLYLRKEAGLTQKQVAAAAKTSEAEVCLIERGKRNPSLNVARRLADALGVTVDELIGKEEEK